MVYLEQCMVYLLYLGLGLANMYIYLGIYVHFGRNVESMMPPDAPRSF